MSRLAETFQQLAEKGRKALVPYIVAGDPEPGFTVAMMHELVRQGADIIELGVPFSDPMAEGPVIQVAHERALVHGVSLSDVLSMVAEFRIQDPGTPVVLMGYANPVEYMGYQQFADRASQAGVDGLLTVDMPPEESAELNQELQRVGIDNIFLLAPTTEHERIEKVAALASGYLYYVSLKGVTGAGNLDVAAVEAKLAELKQITSLPVTVGFGIKDAETAAAVAKVCEGVVVGSALVDRVAKLNQQGVAGDQLLSESAGLIGDMRRAIGQ